MGLLRAVTKDAASASLSTSKKASSSAEATPDAASEAPSSDAMLPLAPVSCPGCNVTYTEDKEGHHSTMLQSCSRTGITW